jgi:hypothetical protein
LFPFIRTEFEGLEGASHSASFRMLSRMNTHKNARLTYARGLELVMDILERPDRA